MDSKDILQIGDVIKVKGETKFVGPNLYKYFIANLTYSIIRYDGMEIYGLKNRFYKNALLKFPDPKTIKLEEDKNLSPSSLIIHVNHLEAKKHSINSRIYYYKWHIANFDHNSSSFQKLPLLFIKFYWRKILKFIKPLRRKSKNVKFNIGSVSSPTLDPGLININCKSIYDLNLKFDWDQYQYWSKEEKKTKKT